MQLEISSGRVDYFKAFLNEQECQHYFNQLIDTVEWRQDKIKMFGKTLSLPRLQAWYGDNQVIYRYSGLTLCAAPWTHELLTLKKQVEMHCYQHRLLAPEEQFNSVLINLYRDQHDSVGWHSDDEKELGNNPVIASLSLGAQRNFKLKPNDKSAANISLMLANGSLLVMSDKLQHCWQHCLPKSGQSCSARINLSFRQVKP